MRLTDPRTWLARARQSHDTARLAGDGFAASETGEGRPPALAEAAPESEWPPLRLELAETLWGEGCLLPGGGDEVLRLAAPLGLSAAASLLLLGAGSGGAALRLAGELGVWVCACEAEAAVLAAATRRVQRAGGAPAKHVTLQAWDASAPGLRRASFHHAIAIESLHGDAGETVLAAMVQALRPGGQLVVLETVAGPAFDPHDASMRAWCRLEHRPPPRKDEWLGEALERLGCEVRVAEDGTARQVLQAVTGWKRLVRDMRINRPTPARAGAIVTEAELWLRRISLLRSGQLRLMRWHAIGR